MRRGAGFHHGRKSADAASGRCLLLSVDPEFPEGCAPTSPGSSPRDWPSTRITKPLPFAEICATLVSRRPIKEQGRMQFEIPEDAQVHIVIGKPGPGPAPRFGRLLLKGALGVMLLAGSFAVGQHFGSSSRAPELAGTAAALPRPAPGAEQYAVPDRPQPREAPGQTDGRVTADFQRQLQQPPTVTPPPGQAIAPGTPGKNPFGLEN